MNVGTKRNQRPDLILVFISFNSQSIFLMRKKLKQQSRKNVIPDFLSSLSLFIKHRTKTTLTTAKDTTPTRVKFHWVLICRLRLDPRNGLWTLNIFQY